MSRVHLISFPHLEDKPENCKWLALLIDTEGALGWTLHTERLDKIDGYKYTYPYRRAYITVGMNEKESRETIREGARLMGVTTYTYLDRRTGQRILKTGAEGRRATETMKHIKPYLVKFHRLANLTITLFKYRTNIPRSRFDLVIETLFGTFLTSKDANPIMLDMAQEQYTALINKAKEEADIHLT